MTAVGAVCVMRCRRVPDLPLASLPLLLGAHQAVESVVWSSGGGAGPATLVWAVIALPLLALWVPLGVLSAAPSRARRRLTVPVAVGVAVAAALAYCLATRPVTAEIRGRTLGYVLQLPYPGVLVTGYVLATVGSLLLAGDGRLRLFGVVVALGAVLCVLLWRLEFLSTWCAFAAVTSGLLLAWVRRPAGAAR